MERSVEMVKTKLILLASVALLLNACCERPAVEWNKIVIDGHMTGVTTPTADNIDLSLGSYIDGVYTSPNGTAFSEGSTPLTAAAVIDAQEVMAHLKEVIGFTTEEMCKQFPESTLSNWAVDLITSSVSNITGKKMDVGILNFGGIRVDFAKGDILLDDVRSMFPFKNCLSYVQLEGRDLLYLIEKMVSENNIQALSGVRLAVSDGMIDTLLVQGKQIDPDALYNVATIDFLLDGGDHISVARNAKKLEIYDELIIDVAEPYVRRCYAAGIPVEYHTDGRVTINGKAE